MQALPFVVAQAHKMCAGRECGFAAHKLIDAVEAQLKCVCFWLAGSTVI